MFLSRAREGDMSIKEHLQFLVMMIPTLLLLIAAAISLLVPTGVS
jgi:hypothetical protein